MARTFKACLTHETDNWRTPLKLYNYLVNQCGYIDLFPFKSDDNQYDKHYVKEKLFINPPFSEINKTTFKQYIKDLVICDNFIILLIPSRTDTKFFQWLLDMYQPKIWFFKGRLHFNDSKSAPFPTLLLMFGRHDFSSRSYINGDIDDFITWFKIP